MQPKLSVIKKRVLFIWNWILKISGILSLINLGADLQSWSKWAIKIYEYIKVFSIDIAEFLGFSIHSIVQFWAKVLSHVLWFLPDDLRASFAIAIIVVAYIIQAAFLKTTKESNKWYSYQSGILRAALLLGAIDGFYVKTVHLFVILYVTITYCNHSISQIKGNILSKVDKQKHIGLLTAYSSLIAIIYSSYYFNIFPFFKRMIVVLQSFYIWFNIYALSTAFFSYIGVLLGIVIGYLERQMAKKKIVDNKEKQ